ncbi:MAG: seg [Candidatus Adlerbacteria bacterium]|nr:seg [Candidatus Adlerbacteria bacterium]
MKFLRISLLVATIFIATPAFAQNFDASLPDPIQYSTIPETPAPGQTVTLQIQGVGTFLGSATITWTQNGKVISAGIGDTALNIAAGQLGSRTVVRASIKSPTQGSYTHDFIVVPSMVNLVWEADTTIPPLYRSKALYSGGAGLLVAAFPQVTSGGSFIASKGLVFQWTLNDDLVPEQSGLGRSVFRFSGNQLKNAEEVGVDIYIGETKVAHGDVVIPATDPTVIFYDRDPLRGEIFDAALPSAIHLIGNELTVQAEPFYFSNTSKKNGTLQYSWTINGSDTTGPDAQSGILTLRQSGSGTGSAIIGISIQNLNTSQLVQSAQTALTVLFGANSTGVSLFGL